MSAKTKRQTTIEFLGTGTSAGVPMPGCACPVCRSADPRDFRNRASILIRYGSRSIVVDTGPEFRLQMVRSGVRHLEAVLITHDHADHMNGFDDVRAFTMKRSHPLPVYARPEALATIRTRFSYIWNHQQKGGGLPKVELIPVSETFDILGLRITPIPVKHGILTIFGYRIGNFAYLTDASDIPASSLPLLENLDTVVLGCVRYKPHPTHMNLAKAKEWHHSLGARQTVLTHFNHVFSHARLEKELPCGMIPAYDGLILPFALE